MSWRNSICDLNRNDIWFKKATRPEWAGEEWELIVCCSRCGIVGIIRTRCPYYRGIEDVAIDELIKEGWRILDGEIICPRRFKIADNHGERNDR